MENNEIKIPDIGIDEVEVIEILVQVNDYVLKEQSLIIVEGEKASMEIPSPYTGIITEIRVKVLDIIKTNSVIMLIDIENSKIQFDEKKINNDVIHNKNIHHNILSKQKNDIYATPFIRRLARLSNIDLSKISGSGRKNRILKQDIENYNLCINSKLNDVYTNKSDTHNITPLNFELFGEVEAIQLNKVKRISGRALLNSWSTVPHVTQFDEVDITDLEEFRKKCNTMPDFKNNKLTLLSFIIKAISKGLEKFPYFNSSMSLDNKTIFLKKYINIGVAVDTLYGLVVPVIKNIKDKSISQISYDVLHQSHKARDKKLTILDCQGGCFTVSSLGGIGGQFFTPIINHPESAILGISRASYKPIWNGIKFIPKLMLPLSLSYDHRIIDGADGVRFITFICHILSDIKLLLI
ncbi:Dihydrolipoyllysine-residue acetyltransferase component of pyruvate dehydrogenase complex [Buchnera aphidicola (Phyllaphis fagi)]|uniref:2-oxo acid dehydrogenase subunit E2 n=1 Tax=Buchnera aphidicola TaxID=9 RepID=UPI003463ECBE